MGTSCHGPTRAPKPRSRVELPTQIPLGVCCRHANRDYRRRGWRNERGHPAAQAERAGRHRRAGAERVRVVRQLRTAVPHRRGDRGALGAAAADPRVARRTLPARRAGEHRGHGHRPRRQGGDRPRRADRRDDGAGLRQADPLSRRAPRAPTDPRHRARPFAAHRRGHRPHRRRRRRHSDRGCDRWRIHRHRDGGEPDHPPGIQVALVEALPR